jgi:cytochrome b
VSLAGEETAKQDAPQGASLIKVWDPFVRLSHWATAAGCVLNLFVLDASGRAHLVVGYGVAALLVSRIVWGFAGSGHARFADFFPWPKILLAYLSDLAHGHERRYKGHNPAGAAMMLTLMALLAALSVTGWMQGLDAFWGAEWLQDLHAVLANGLLALALLHAGAALVESWRHSENLVWAMVTGRKRA